MAKSQPAQQTFIRRWLNNRISSFRHSVAHAEALPQLSFLGMLCGLLTAAVAVLFRLSFEIPLESFLPAGKESFEELPVPLRFALPIIGALLIGLILHFNAKENRALGVGHIIDRMQYHQSHLPFKNALIQFFGAAIAIISGNSVGREGPAIHLGATASSLLGQKLKLPNNTLRVLTSCGVAAAISASFNTPLAGVIFAMEVVLMEYTIAGFIPVIIASVSGAVVSRAVFGDEQAFSLSVVELGSLWEIPFLMICGIAIGLAATLMLKIFQQCGKFTNKPILLRMFVAGLLTGSVATVLPQVMGVGYDTLEKAMLGEMGFWLLAAIVVAKLTLSSFSVSLGMPGGVIGPSLVIGACIGGCLGIIGGIVNPELASTPGLYATLCMGAMMGAVLNAPLAALMAVLELTYSPSLLLPSMVTIVTATLTARTISHLPGLFSIGKDRAHYTSPVFQILNRAGVTSLMDRNFSHHSHLICPNIARKLLEKKPHWLVIEDVGEPKFILRPADLALYLEIENTQLWDEGQEIDLHEIPGERWQLHPIHSRATLQEALLLMQENNGRAVYVAQPASPLMTEVAGIVTKDDIDNYYQ